MYRMLLVLLLPALVHAKPNILFMMADDLGWNDVGYHGSEIKTPNIDELAERGVELDRYYAFPMCSPTRVALMTGRSPIRQGVDTPIGPHGGMPLDEHLLPQTLRAAGYQTFITGKWHLGLEHASSHPNNRGFDHAHGHLASGVDYFTHIWEGGLDWHRNGKVIREEGYTTELITEEAVSLIERRDKAKPMFLYVAFNAPHTPLQSTEKYLQRYPDIGDPHRKLFAAMVSAVDDGVGKILDTLETEGIADDTLVVWVSDNGGALQAGADNSPLRGGKGTTFEGGLRVPGLIYQPGVLEGGKFSQMFTAHDWFQTLTTAVGVTPMNTKPFDGIDMWAALTEGEKAGRRDTVIGINGSYTIFREGWKLVEHTPRRSDTTTMHLFRILDDPSEEHDLIDENSDLAKELLAAIRSIPRPPSVSQDRPGEGFRTARRQNARTGGGAGRGGGAGGGGRAGGARNGGRGGGGGRDPLAGWKEETREPWVEVAIRD